METILCAAVGTASDKHGLEALLCMETVLCAAVGTASHQDGLEACTVYGNPTVCNCRHSKSSAWVRSMYCVWRPYCVQLWAQLVISMGWKHVLCTVDLGLG
jgi:hypothetical protein